jgi:hypothetical protein
VSSNCASSDRLLDTLVVAGLVVLAAVSCATRETPLPERAAMNKAARATAADLAGCYGVEIGRWSPAVNLAAEPSTWSGGDAQRATGCGV